MKLIVGLGNPGEKFRNTPHNIGFAVVDEFARENNFPGFKLKKKSKALISKKEGILLIKPLTFMNESGKSIKEILSQNRDQIEEIIVIHDDIDLPLGKIKIVKDRGSAGHKGVESIIKEVGRDNFVRIRVGVVPASGKPEKPEKFVLNKTEIPREIIKKAQEALKSLIKNGFERAASEFN